MSRERKLVVLTRSPNWTLQIQVDRPKPIGRQAPAGVYSVPEGREQTTLAELTAEIVSAYVSYNQITPPDLGTLVGAVASELRKVSTTVEQPPESKPAPAVPVRRSIRPDHLVCLVCSKPQKTLKRHLSAAHGLTPAQYRERFELKADYPMIAPSYAQQRSKLAVQIGLGRPKKPARRSRKKPMPESSPAEVGQ
jgi:predicted transcriptional regulator